VVRKLVSKGALRNIPSQKSAPPEYWKHTSRSRVNNQWEFLSSKAAALNFANVYFTCEQLDVTKLGAHIDEAEFSTCLCGPVLFYGDSAQAFQPGAWMPPGLVIETPPNVRCVSGVGKRTAEAVMQHYMQSAAPCGSLTAVKEEGSQAARPSPATHQGSSQERVLARGSSSSLSSSSQTSRSSQCDSVFPVRAPQSAPAASASTDDGTSVMAVVPASPNTFEASQTEPCQAVMPLSTGEMDQWINDSPRNPDLSEYAVGNCALMLQTIPSYSHPAEHGNAALWSGEAAWPANQGWTDFNCQCGEGGGSGAWQSPVIAPDVPHGAESWPDYRSSPSTETASLFSREDESFASSDQFYHTASTSTTAIMTPHPSLPSWDTSSHNLSNGDPCSSPYSLSSFEGWSPGTEHGLPMAAAPMDALATEYFSADPLGSYLNTVSHSESLGSMPP